MTEHPMRATSATTLVRTDVDTGAPQPTGAVSGEIGDASAAVVKTLETARPAAADAEAQRRHQRRTAILAGPILPTLMMLALPTMTVLVAQTAVNIAETYYVGRLGTDALAGVALVFPVFMLMTMMSNGGLGSGAASAVARAIGAQHKHDADALAFHTVVLAVVVGAVFTASTISLGPLLYHALGGRGDALGAALKYSNYLFAGAIPVWIVNMLAAALRGAGNVRVPATITLVGAMVLIPTSPLLIFGFGPVPALGIAGAGLAFGLYYCGAMLVLLRYMTAGRSDLRLKVTALEWRLFADILRVGVPTAFSAVLTNLTVILVTGAVGLFGTTALAAYGIASRLDYIMIPLLFGLSTAVLTMVGINVGAGQTARARHIAWMGSLMGAAFIEVIGLTIGLSPGIWLHLFSHDPNVVADGATYLHFVAPAYGALGLGFVLGFAAQGAGHVLWPMIGIVARLLLAAGGGWIAVRHFGAGLPTLSAMVAISLVVYAGICALGMIASHVWRTGPGRTA